MAHVERRAPGRWRARYRDPDGRERSRTFSRRVDADRFLATVEAAKVRGDWIDPTLGRRRLDDWAAAWLARVGPALKPKTVATYNSLLRSRILPALGAHSLGALRPGDVQAFIAEMEGAGLSTSRIRQAHVVLAEILDAAVRDGLVSRNAARGVKLPPLERREAAYLEPEVVDEIADAMPEPSYRLLVRVLGVLGLRFGEAAALQRRSVDLLRRRLRIEESIAEVSAGLVRGPTKTHATRSVPLPRSLAKELEEHLASTPGGPDSPLFVGARGGLLRYSVFYRRVWRPTLTRLGLASVGVHVLRHSAAARMIAAGASAKAVQSVLGHGSAAFTLTVYGHMFDADLDDLAARIDECEIPVPVRRIGSGTWTTVGVGF